MPNLIDTLQTIAPLVGNSPVTPLQMPNIELYAKLEYCNYSGSVKDRAAYNILREAILAGNITSGTTVVESSSGNLALSLAHMCRKLGLPFIPVIDPNINPVYEATLKLLCDKVVKVEKPDHTEGYLLTRINTVKKLCQEIKNVFWTNQYENEHNFKAYQKDISGEIMGQLPGLQYMFVAVSSGGAITGLSRQLKMYLPDIKIIGVDVEGSVVFGREPKKRHVSGLGASKRSLFIEKAEIDDIMIIPQEEIVAGAYELLMRHQLFTGASTGAAYMAIKKYFSNYNDSRHPRVLFIAADRGQAYIDTIYNPEWCKRLQIAPVYETE